MKKLLTVVIIIFISCNFFAQELKLTPSVFGSMKARHIGPATMSGRISTLDASNSDWRLIYVGAATGGVWKSTNGGTTFRPVFDDHIQSIGAITIDQQHPDTVWVGTGEVWTRNSISPGGGIYKTTNGGEKWELMGLQETEHIAKIIVHPDNSDIVFVAALGNVWNTNPERGVYKTTDGGRTWAKILFVNENTGCSDLAMDPDNPNLIYAGIWNFLRKPYTFNSGGPGSGLYKSEDCGNTWNEISNTFVDGEKGRISVAFSPADPNILYSLIESDKTGLYRSTDKGKNWELMTTSTYVSERPFYFSLILPDPVDTNRIYKPGFTLYVSDDGGYSFTSPFVEGGDVHSDLHALWINPENKNQIYLGTDGGLYTSYDRGSTWHHARNLPLSQFYHVRADNDNPYNVYGGLQDNGSWVGPSQSVGGINNSDWMNIGFGDGFNVLPDPADNNIIFWQYQGGNTMRFYRDTREAKEIKPFSDDPNEKLRFNWDTPIAFSPTVEGVIYIGSQYLFRSSDRGDSWEKISPDLTTDDAKKQNQEESGGLTIDNSTAENHCTIFTISESPVNPDVVWAGTDDGNLQVTTDAGETWSNASDNITGLPEERWCSKIFASNHDAAAAYAVFNNYRNGDKNVYVYKTADFGATWRSLATKNIQSFARVIVEDFVNPNLLFLGTDGGLYLSVDDGLSWVRFEGDVPQVPIYDLVIHERESDLVIGTHGRGIMILDDIAPLRELTVDVINSKFHFFSSEPYIITNPQFEQSFGGDDEFVGRNSSTSAIITYYMNRRHIFGDMYIEVLDEDGNVVKKLAAGKNKGINRVPWPLRKKPPKVKASSPLLIFRTIFGPTYTSGDYTIKVVKGKEEYSTSISLINDPDSRHSAEDRKIQQEVLYRAYDLLEDLSYYDQLVVDLSEQLENVKPVVEVEDLIERLNTIHKELVSTNPNRLSGEIRLSEKIGDVYAGVLNYLGKPTESQIDRLELLNNEFDAYKKTINDKLELELPGINEKLLFKGNNKIKTLERSELE